MSIKIGFCLVTFDYFMIVTSGCSIVYSFRFCFEEIFGFLFSVRDNNLTLTSAY